MPNAIVATTTIPSSRRNRTWVSWRIAASSPAWYGRAVTPRFESQAAVDSTLLRERQ